MKVQEIDIFRVALPFDAGRKPAAGIGEGGGDAFNAASRSLARMESLMVRLTTDTGVQGWGEGFGHLINPVTFAALAGSVGRFFLGTDVTGQPESFSGRMRQAHRAFHAFGATGPVMYALSALDTALWDICAKAAGVPLRRLLGAGRDAVPCYASLVCYDNDPAEVARQAVRAADLGFRKIKLHETVPAAVLAARDALGDGVELMVDVNCPWSRRQAQEAVRRMAGARLGWVEEPIWPPADLAGLAQLRRLGVPVAAGENAAGVQGFEQHFQAGALDVAQPSVAKIGGVSGMIEVVRLAREHGVKVVPHCFYYGPGLSAAAQIVASLSDDVFLEVPFLQWARPLHAQQQPVPVLSLPDAPGIGFEPDMRVLESHLLDRANLA